MGWIYGSPEGGTLRTLAQGRKPEGDRPRADLVQKRRKTCGSPPPKGIKRGLHARTARKRAGTILATRPFGRGNLDHLLSNPVYAGKVRHRAQLHEGEREAIVTEELFGEAQSLLASQAPRRRHKKNIEGSHLVNGLVFDETGDRLSPFMPRRKASATATMFPRDW